MKQNRHNYNYALRSNSPGSYNRQKRKRGKNTRLIILLIPLFIIATISGILLFNYLMPGGLVRNAAAVAASESSVPITTSAQVLANTNTQESDQTAPSPSPSLAIDSNDKYFLSAGETVKVNSDNTEWTYSSPDLYIHIQRYDKNDLKLHYFIADIRTKGSGLIKSAFSDETHPGSNALLPSKVAKKLHAVFLLNSDYFEDKRNPSGVIIRHSKVYKDDTKADTLAVMPDGTLQAYSAGEIDAAGLLNLGVQDTFSFGPTLIRNGIINSDLSKALLNKANPRTGIGMIENGHYIAIVVEGRNPNDNRGVTLEEFAQMFADQGCTVAYNFDGGASSAMVFMGNTLNLPTDALTTKTYRRVPDVLVIGTSDAVPGN